MSATTGRDILETLAANPVRHELNAYLKELKAACGVLAREQVLVILGQWFHPLHYFPKFLSRLISVTPHLEAQTFISRILWQELGEGSPERAHERLYVETVLDNGFTESERVVAEPPLAATERLVGGYEAASRDYLPGLGFLYGTEVVDLPMVATIGELMRRCTGKRELPWVSVHVTQEPEHIESSGKTLEVSLTPEEFETVEANAEEMWRLWINFFKEIEAKLLPRAASVV